MIKIVQTVVLKRRTKFGKFHEFRTRSALKKKKKKKDIIHIP